MAQIHGPRYASGYDLFKLLVVIVLVILLIFLLFRDHQQGLPLSDVTKVPSTETFTSIPPTVSATRTEVAVIASFTLEVPTSIPATITLLPSPMPTEIATQSPSLTPIPSQTATQAVGEVPCPSAPSRIKIGDSIRVLSRLNFRKGPGLNWPVILTNNPATELAVIGGPICTLRSTPGGPKAYLWWNVRMKNGLEGWSAEASLINPNYFLDPLP